MKKLLLLIFFGNINNIYCQCWLSSSTAKGGQVTAFNHLATIKNDSTLWTIGDNYYGELGLGTNSTTGVGEKSFKQVGKDKNWTIVSAGNQYTMAIKSDGTLWGWGLNQSGQLGIGSKSNMNLPTRCGSASDWKYVSAGNQFTMAIKKNGTLWKCGIISSESFTQVGKDSIWVEVASSFQHCIGRKKNGTIWALGDDGSSSVHTTKDDDFFQIGSDKDWLSIAVGLRHSLATKIDGTLWAWGENKFGQLGDGTIKNPGKPIQIDSSKNWAAIAAGNYHSLSVKTDGSLWAWGDNGYGQLGDGTTNDKTTPIQIGMDKDWKNVSGGQLRSYAMKVDNTMWGWGSGGFTGIYESKTPIKISCLSLSVNLENNIKNFDLYPNPTNNRINISYDSYSDTKKHILRIYNIDGKIVYESNINQKELLVDLQFLNSGLYMCAVFSESGEFEQIRKISLVK